MNIRANIESMIGNTPIAALPKYAGSVGAGDNLLVKLEMMNPAGSVKDRAALSMIDDAERRGLLRPGSVIVESTSGNTGIGLAAIAATRGYRVILTMPETMSIERRRLLASYGAELSLTEGSKGMKGAIARAEQLIAEIPGSFMPGQFTNPANPAAHYATTGPELWEATGGKIDMFVACVGTGGTITGAGRYLKERNPDIKVIAVEPAASPVLSGGAPGPHKIQGIGAGFVPDILDVSIIDGIIKVSDAEAFAAARGIAREDGLLVGISSGAAVWAAAELSKRPEYSGRTVVALAPDSGERYLSTGIYD